MKSHAYHIRPAEVARLLGGLLPAPIVFAGVMWLGALSGILPAPWPALDVDRTILVHQAQASQSPADADVLFIGDSSCLMDVAGVKLEQALAEKHHVLNLGTFMYVGFGGYSAMLSRYADANPGRLRTVVVLVHPEMLRGMDAPAYYRRFLSDFYAGADLREPDSVHGQLCGVFGLNIFQDRFLGRAPLPLPKEWARFYGFNLDLYQFMNRERGSAVDPHQYAAGPGQGNAEYHLAPALQDQCRALRAALPPSARVVVGLAPVPESFAPPDHTSRCQRILAQWAEWVGADGVLASLPMSMPDRFFASTTHLNAAGRLAYSELLARELQPQLEAAANKHPPYKAADEK